MPQRNLRSVPAALLMTTALSWSLPGLAQISTTTDTAPSRAASATAPAAGIGTQRGTAAPPTGTSAGSSTGTPATRGGPGAGSNRLPPGFEPATPGAKSSAPAAGSPSGGAYPSSSGTTRP